MRTFEDFEQGLREALPHLHDLAYQPDEWLCVVAGCQPEAGNKALQAIIRQAIEALKPGPDIPSTSRIWRVYDVLAYRYIRGLTQVETACHLGITPRHLRREQQYAVANLARWLWERNRPDPALVDSPPHAETTGAKPQSPTWQAQVREDLASLHQHTPGVIADVGETIAGAISLGQTLTTRHGVSLKIAATSPELKTTIHPTALRQILLTAIEKLVQHMASGEITLHAGQKEGRIEIRVAGGPAIADLADPPLSSDFIRETLAIEGGTVNIQVKADQVIFQMTLPQAGKRKVLVVDDNIDLVHFYRRYTAKTRYEIIHIATGRQLFATIEVAAPDIIVLDVMLPDVDGWELLTHLYEHPATRLIPVIVCSVVRREELALALGAAYYMAKPVRRRQFIRALDQVLNQP